jgi:hypothetical protein
MKHILSIFIKNTEGVPPQASPFKKRKKREYNYPIKNLWVKNSTNLPNRCYSFLL